MAGRADGIDSYRYERKYVVPCHLEGNLASILRCSRFGFREIFTERTVNNLYFDTPLFRFFHENVQGVSDRMKVRIRWYGDRLSEGRCRLEIKRRNGLVGTKEVHQLILKSGELMEFGLLKRLDLPGGLSYGLSELRPTLLNRYKRRYFLSADGRYRVTLDHELRYSTPSALGCPGCMGSPDAMSVLELKYDCDADPGAAAMASEWPFSLSKKSKYVTGMAAVYNC